VEIIYDLFLDELQRPTQGDCNAFSVREDGYPKIQIENDDQAQAEIREFIGDSHVKCDVIESNENQIVGQLESCLQEFVRDTLLVNY
jgi:hypothetical protein